ncbi:MAG: hypothetical protein JSS81_26380 [Acidobacteria bacterium]|nr:hypothetical protein [Acidobacteriota bacterium]
MNRKIPTVLSIWLAAALAVGAAGVFGRAPAPLVPVAIWTPVIAVLLVFWRSENFRAWVDGVDPRVLVAVHLTRFVGVWFLILAARGALPAEFAVRGGWGDIAAAAGALVVLRLPLRKRAARAALLVWNAFGLLDILMVVATGARLLFTNAGSMGEMTKFPLVLLPLFVVPLVIATHLLIFAKLRRGSVGSRESRVESQKE